MSLLATLKKVIVLTPFLIRDQFRKWRKDIYLEEVKRIAVIGVGFNDLPRDKMAGQYCRIYNDNGKECISIGDHVICDGVLNCNKRGSITIGDYTVINHDTFIASDVSITIGKYCFIARDVIIQDNNSHPIDPLKRQKQSLHQYDKTTDTYESENSPITIEDNVWIGTRAIILKGVTIGDGSIVAAGAVVTKNVPPRTIVAGNPAQVVKRIEVQGQP